MLLIRGWLVNSRSARAPVGPRVRSIEAEHARGVGLAAVGPDVLRELPQRALPPDVVEFLHRVWTRVIVGQLWRMSLSTKMLSMAGCQNLFAPAR